jgi:DNA (cytosine-5)-methyltransferase 1
MLVRSFQTIRTMAAQHTFFEFFAGGGMARAGLGENWSCAFANDFDAMKATVYAQNWGAEHLVCEDVAKLSVDQLPGHADLIWASFPCQDLSLAGEYRGLGTAQSNSHTRSGTFWPFWGLVQQLRTQGRAPRAIILENVYGAVTSNGGRDFCAIATSLAAGGYRFGAMVIDARHFLPQSRPRLFIVGVDKSVPIPPTLLRKDADPLWEPERLQAAVQALEPFVAESAVRWHLPKPAVRTKQFADILEDNPSDTDWHAPEETARLFSLMSPLNIAKVEAAKLAGRRMVGGVYRRTRPDGRGGKIQRAEVRFDDTAGCLRTPAGGSSRQLILVVDGKRVRSRLLSGREAARLMGLPDSYRLPTRYNDAYHVAGDGVAAPVVSYIARNLLEPLLAFAGLNTAAIAAE